MGLKILKDIEFEQITDVRPDGYEGNAPGRKRIVKRKIVFCFTLKQLIIDWIKYARRCKHPLDMPETLKTIFNIYEGELQ